VGFVSCIILLLHTVWCLVRCVLQSCCVVTAAFITTIYGTMNLKASSLAEFIFLIVPESYPISA